MTLKDITNNPAALDAFGGDGTGSEPVELIDSSNGKTYKVDGGRWFYFASACGSDAVSEDGTQGSWVVV